MAGVWVPGHPVCPHVLWEAVSGFSILFCFLSIFGDLMGAYFLPWRVTFKKQELPVLGLDIPLETHAGRQGP